LARFGFLGNHAFKPWFRSVVSKRGFDRFCLAANAATAARTGASYPPSLAMQSPRGLASLKPAFRAAVVFPKEAAEPAHTQTYANALAGIAETRSAVTSMPVRLTTLPALSTHHPAHLCANRGSYGAVCGGAVPVALSARVGGTSVASSNRAFIVCRAAVLLGARQQLAAAPLGPGTGSAAGGGY
jgi:hypothetical protein